MAAVTHTPTPGGSERGGGGRGEAKQEDDKSGSIQAQTQLSIRPLTQWLQKRAGPQRR